VLTINLGDRDQRVSRISAINVRRVAPRPFSSKLVSRIVSRHSFVRRALQVHDIAHRRSSRRSTKECQRDRPGSAAAICVNAYAIITWLPSVPRDFRDWDRVASAVRRSEHRGASRGALKRGAIREEQSTWINRDKWVVATAMIAEWLSRDFSMVKITTGIAPPPFGQSVYRVKVPVWYECEECNRTVSVKVSVCIKVY